MKMYKRTYGISLLCLFLEIIIVGALCVLVGDIVLFFLNKSALGVLLINYIAVSLLLMVFGLSLSVLVNTIIHVFTSASVYVHEGFISHMDKKLDLDKIKYITLYLPEMQSRTSSSPLNLALFINDQMYIVIKRPSIRLVIYLKKRCKNAEFEVDNLKAIWKRDLLIGAAAIAVGGAVVLWNICK